MDLSVIIVNYNVQYFLEQCLYAVVKAGKNLALEIFVIDNHSIDGSKEYLEKKFPQVIFRWNEENVGFAKANNSVLKAAKGSLILFLNPDTIVPEDCFEKCQAFFKTHKNAGALGVRMLDGSGNFLRESKRSFPSPSASFFKLAGFTDLFPRSALFSKYYAGQLAEDESAEVDVLAGAFLMLTAEALEKTRGFDEAFFMYGEDIDLSYRVQQAGFTNYYFPGTCIVHFKGESTQRKSPVYIKQFYGAMHLFVMKHYSKRRITLFFMNISISLGKMVSLLKLYGKNLLFPTGKDVSVRQRGTLVVADQHRFNEMIQLIKHATDPLVILGRVSLDLNDKAASAGCITGIGEIVKKNAASKIIFCEDPLEFKKMIGVMQQLRGKVDFLFHAKDSKSIVGSSSKNEKGIFISFPVNNRIAE